MALATVLIVGLASGARSQQSFGDFSGSPLVQLGPDGTSVILAEDFWFRDKDRQKWDVPKGYASNGASIPRFFWSVIGGPLDGPYRDAAIFHDYYCEFYDVAWPDPWKRDWKKVHRAFYDGMRARGVNEVKAKIMYGAVYHFGPRWTTDGKQVRKFTAQQDSGPVAVSLKKYVEDRNPSLEEIERFDAAEKLEFESQGWKPMQERPGLKR
jgi:hypothetical protein